MNRLTELSETQQRVLHECGAAFHDAYNHVHGLAHNSDSPLPEAVKAKMREAFRLAHFYAADQEFGPLCERLSQGRCGVCCRMICKTEVTLFGHLNRGDGDCKHLGVDGRCGIYATRPLQCSVDALHHDLGHLYATRAQTYAFQAATCVLLRYRYGLPL